MTISVRDRMSIELAGRPYKYEGAREADVTDLLGYPSAARFWQRVNWLLEQPDAEAAMPAVVHRLQRQRVARQEARKARRVGWAS